MRMLHRIPGLHRGGAERREVCVTLRHWDAVSTTGLDDENMHGVTDSASSISHVLVNRSRRTSGAVLAPSADRSKELK